MNALNDRSVEVGCIEGEHKYLAAVHEYGCTIKATNAKYLTVPCSPKAVGHKASDFPDLFFLEAKSGHKFLAKPIGKDRFECYYWLTASVNIPERAFLRNGHDENIERVLDQSELYLKELLDGRKTPQQYLDAVGQQLTTAIKTYARDLSSPPNSNITQEAKGSSNPLVDTGEMIEGITFRTE
jgi:hypothetical protein